ncbi:unnamed protein product, partial [Rangifer tarandus platyrhynchus]
QEYWSGLPVPPPPDLPDPGIELTTLVSPALASRFFTTEPPWKPKVLLSLHQSAERWESAWRGAQLPSNGQATPAASQPPPTPVGGVNQDDRSCLPGA